MDGHPPSPGWSPTIPRMVTQMPMDGHQPFQVWSPKFQQMATHHSKDSHPPSLGWSPTTHRMLTHHPLGGHIQFPSTTAWLFTIPMMVTHFPSSPTNIKMVSHNSKNYHLLYPWRSTTILPIAIHHQPKPQLTRRQIAIANLSLARLSYSL